MAGLYQVLSHDDTVRSTSTLHMITLVDVYWFSCKTVIVVSLTSNFGFNEKLQLLTSKRLNVEKFEYGWLQSKPIMYEDLMIIMLVV